MFSLPMITELDMKTLPVFLSPHTFGEAVLVAYARISSVLRMRCLSQIFNPIVVTDAILVIDLLRPISVMQCPRNAMCLVIFQSKFALKIAVRCEVTNHST